MTRCARFALLRLASWPADPATGAHASGLKLCMLLHASSSRLGQTWAGLTNAGSGVRKLTAVTVQVPAQWTVLAYASLRPLSSWFVNLLQRVQQLVDWTADLSVPKTVWISGEALPTCCVGAALCWSC